jgi:hypothetical protein
MRILQLTMVAALSLGWLPAQQTDRHGLFDRILDIYVRDGLVYYRALQIERASLDRYVAALDVPAAQVASWSRDDQLAFWINAYNALVLRTVIDNYPIRGKASEYPSNSIRQIPGSFETRRHRVAGQMLTLDEIETKFLLPLGDARAVLALGRGALGSGRLRSEAYRAARLELQLADVVKECASRTSCVRVDSSEGLLEVSPVFSWREEAFVRSFAAGASEQWANRSPIERAVLSMVYAHLFPSERAYLSSNKFQMRFGALDWTLNDLTGRTGGDDDTHEPRPHR